MRTNDPGLEATQTQLGEVEVLPDPCNMEPMVVHNPRGSVGKLASAAESRMVEMVRTHCCIQ